jgi:hypothetical protein
MTQAFAFITDLTPENVWDMLKGKDYDYPYGTDSCDPSIQVKFEDGSKLHIGNPNESVYPFFAHEL